MSHITVTSTEAQRLGEQEDAIVQKSNNFLTSSLKWSLALLGVKNVLLNMQATFITTAIALIGLFVISSRTAPSDCRKTFINFMFLILGCLVVGVTIDSIVLNSYIKWVLYGLFLVMVAANPNYPHIYQKMKLIFQSVCGAISLRLRNLVLQSQVIIENLFKTNVVQQEEPSINNNAVTQPIGSDRGGVVVDIV